MTPHTAPVPFAKRMRLVWRGDLKTIHFYQVQVRLYESGTKIVSFSLEDLNTYRNIIDRVTGVLSDPDENLKTRSEDPAIPFESLIHPSEGKEAMG